MSRSSSRSSRTPEISLGSFNRVNLEGSNAGATMFIRRAMEGEPEDCCCINIYTNSNVQGTNNSLMLGSNIKMKNPGVHLYFGDLKLGQASPGSIARRTVGTTSEFGSMFMFVFIPVILFMWLSSLLI